MSTTTHPNSEQLVLYIANPQSEEFKKLSLHLAQCAPCRSQVNTLSAMQLNLGMLEAESYEQSIADSPELEQIMQQQFIERYVDDQLLDNDKQHTGTIIQKNPMALKAALHYASHSSAMKKKLIELTEQQPDDNAKFQTAQNQSTGTTLFTTIIQWLTQRTPVWFTVPATALATTVLVFVLAPGFRSHSTDITIASYQDNAIIQFQQKNKTPGIGFFSNAHKTVKPYGNVQVQFVAKDTIALSWPIVHQAESYTLRLQVFENGQKITLDEITTTATSAEFKGVKADLDRRYEWILSGQTKNTKVFYATGGFVIDH